MANGLLQVPQVEGWGNLQGQMIDLASGTASPSGGIGGALTDEYGNPNSSRKLSTEELAPYLASWNSPASVSGRATAQAQDNGPGFNLKGLINGGLAAGVGGLFAGGALGLGGLGGATDLAGTGASAFTDFGAGNTGFGNLAASAGTGAATAAGGGMDLGNLSFDEGGLPSYSSPDLNTSNFPDMNPDAPNSYDQAMREAGINPSSPGALDNFKNWLTQNPGSAAQLLGKLGATALGAFGANRQANKLTGLANQYTGFGAPSRARYEASMTPGFDPTSIPGYSGAVDTASKSILARLSATGGNPFGNPGGLIDANKQIIAGTALPAIQDYQRVNASTGFGAPMSAALNLQQGAIGADANTLNALGYGLNSITNPQPSLQDLIDKISNSGSYKPNTGI